MGIGSGSLPEIRLYGSILHGRQYPTSDIDLWCPDITVEEMERLEALLGGTRTMVDHATLSAAAGDRAGLFDALAVVAHSTGRDLDLKVGAVSDRPEAYDVRICLGYDPGVDRWNFDRIEVGAMLFSEGWEALTPAAIIAKAKRKTGPNYRD